MDDILYIVLGVVWLAISIYQSQRKMKQKQQKAAQQRMESEEATNYETQETEKKRSFIDQILEELNQEKEEDPQVYSSPPPPPPPPPPIPKPQPARTYTSSLENYRSMGDLIESDSKLSKEYYKSYNKPGRSDTRKPERTRDVEAHPFIEYDDEIEGFELDFDLREAIIYSEILKRPYT